MIVVVGVVQESRQSGHRPRFGVGDPRSEQRRVLTHIDRLRLQSSDVVEDIRRRTPIPWRRAPAPSDQALRYLQRQLRSLGRDHRVSEEHLLQQPLNSPELVSRAVDCRPHCLENRATSLGL